MWAKSFFFHVAFIHNVDIIIIYITITHSCGAYVIYQKFPHAAVMLTYTLFLLYYINFWKLFASYLTSFSAFHRIYLEMVLPSISYGTVSLFIVTLCPIGIITLHKMLCYKHDIIKLF